MSADVAAQFAAAAADAHCGEELRQSLVEPSGEMPPTGMQHEVRVFVCCDAELVLIERRHHDVVAAIGADVVSVRGWTQSIRVILLDGAEADHSDRARRVQAQACRSEEGAELLKPQQAGADVCAIALRVDFEICVLNQAPCGGCAALRERASRASAQINLMRLAGESILLPGAGVAFVHSSRAEYLK